MDHNWSALNHLQIGRYAEYFFKMRLVLLGLDVYSAEIDDRGIDFVVRKEPDRYWDIQVKSVRGNNYVFMRKSSFRIRPNLLIGLALFKDGCEPDLFLLPATRWERPDNVFVDRDYEGLASEPEYGINLSQRGLAALEPFRWSKIANRIFG